MRRSITALTLVVIPALETIASACPMCKDSIGGAPPGGIGMGGGGGPTGGLPGGFNTSVYIMLLGFFGALGLVTMTIVRGARSAIGSQSKPLPRE